MQVQFYNVFSDTMHKKKNIQCNHRLVMWLPKRGNAVTKGW